MFKRQLSVVLICAFVFSLVTPIPYVETPLMASILPAPGQMVSLSAAYQPAIIRGITVHKDNPFLFDFIVDAGQDRLKGDVLKAEGARLIKYFLATLAIPEKDLWVNLSPYEKSRIIPNALGQTDMGRDLLAQDYILKQITASLIYPEKGLGKEFWNRVYAKVQEKHGNIQIPVNTFNKVWIMGDSAQVYVKGNTAFVSECHLKVMLEEDYLALTKNSVGVGSKPTLKRAGYEPAPTKDTSQIIRDLILPELEREVNQGKNFAPLRQIFNSIILASWYKNNLKQSILNQVYANHSKVKGIDLEDKNVKQEIYNRYLQAYKKGVFNYIKDEPVRVSGASVPRKYFSGGVSPAMATKPSRTLSPANVLRSLTSAASVVLITVNLSIKTPSKLTDPNIQQMPYPYTIPKIAAPQISNAAMSAKTAEEMTFRDLFHLASLIKQNLGSVLSTFPSLQGVQKSEIYARNNVTMGDYAYELVQYDHLFTTYQEGLKEIFELYTRNRDSISINFDGNVANLLRNNVLGDLPKLKSLLQMRLEEKEFSSSKVYMEAIVEAIAQYYKDPAMIGEFLENIQGSRHIAVRVRSGSATSQAMIVDGGIDLQASRMQWDIKGDQVEMKIDKAMLERISHEGIESLTPEIIGITPVKDIEALIRKGG